MARNGASNAYRDRSGEILFMDAQQLGKMVNCRNRELTEAAIQRMPRKPG